MTRRLPMAALLTLLGLIAACGTTPQLPATSPSLVHCRQIFADNDARLRAAGIRDAQAGRVAGYPFLRVDRLLASFATEANNAAQRAAWLARATAHDAEGRELEIARLSPTLDSALIDQLRSCRAALGTALRDDDDAWQTMLDATQVADDYSVTRRVLGLYPVSARVTLASVKRMQKREMPRLIDSSASDAVGGEHYGLSADASSETIAPGPAPWRQDALGIPLFTDTERARLLRRHAPELSIETRSDDDRPGRVTRNTAPFINGAQAVLYSQLAYTRFGNEVLPQLVYTWWFAARTAQGRFDALAGPLDGLSWRVTLDSDGQPLTYDLVHNCGCYHMFFPSARLRLRSPANTLEEPPWVPFTIPVAWHGRLRLALASGTHYLTALAPAAATPPDHGYLLLPYTELRALPAGEQRSSLFDDHGLVPTSARGERWFLWPMGVVAAGSMRQWGHQATAFVGRRHFDEARLLERYFERVEQRH